MSDILINSKSSNDHAGEAQSAGSQKKHFNGVSLLSATNIYNNPSLLEISLGKDARDPKFFGFCIDKFLEDRGRMRPIVSSDAVFASIEEACDAVKEFLESCLHADSNQSEKNDQDPASQLISNLLSDEDSVPYDDIFVLTQDRIDEIIARLRQDYGVFTYSGTLKTFPFQYQFAKYLQLDQDQKILVNECATSKNQLFINKYFSGNAQFDWFIVGGHPHKVIASGDSSDIPTQDRVNHLIQENETTCFLYKRL